jgi:hypothetical protein
MACRGGKNLTGQQKEPLEKAKDELRKLFRRDSKQNRKKSNHKYQILSIVIWFLFFVF